jgi:hypothetical protein
MSDLSHQGLREGVASKSAWDRVKHRVVHHGDMVEKGTCACRFSSVSVRPRRCLLIALVLQNILHFARLNRTHHVLVAPRPCDCPHPRVTQVALCHGPTAPAGTRGATLCCGGGNRSQHGSIGGRGQAHASSHGVVRAVMSVCCGSLSGAVTCLTRGIGCMVCCSGRYRALPVESVTDNAGTLDPNMDIGEYVRFQTAKERTQVTPPWFFPTHLCTCTVMAGLGPKMDMSDAHSISISREIRGGSPSLFFSRPCIQSVYCVAQYLNHNTSPKAPGWIIRSNTSTTSPGRVSSPPSIAYVGYAWSFPS